MGFDLLDAAAAHYPTSLGLDSFLMLIRWPPARPKPPRPPLPLVEVGGASAKCLSPRPCVKPADKDRVYPGLSAVGARTRRRAFRGRISLPTRQFFAAPSGTRFRTGFFSSHTKPFHFAGWLGCRFIRRFFRQQRSRQHVGLDVVSPSYYREDEF